MIFSVAYLLARRLLGCLMVLARREVSKDAELLIPRPENEHLGLEHGHRTLTITRKGGKVVTIPLAPRTARAIDLATGTGASHRRRRGAARIDPAPEVVPVTRRPCGGLAQRRQPGPAHE